MEERRVRLSEVRENKLSSYLDYIRRTRVWQMIFPTECHSDATLCMYVHGPVVQWLLIR